MTQELANQNASEVTSGKVMELILDIMAIYEGSLPLEKKRQLLAEAVISHYQTILGARK